MNEILLEILKLVIMVVMLVIIRYFIPWIKTQIGIQNMQTITEWAKYAVLSAQQTLQAASGKDRKAVVTEFLKELLTAKNIFISDEQLDILIEAAVKQMKMSESKNI